jgi:N,N'-diacetylchitobiose transport system permease protein
VNPRSPLARTGLSVLALALAAIWGFPVYWMLNSAFLPNVVLQSTDPTLLPFGGSFDNLRVVVTDPAFLSALGTSLVVTLTTVVARSCSRCCSSRCCPPRGCSSPSTR